MLRLSVSVKQLLTTPNKFFTQLLTTPNKFFTQLLTNSSQLPTTLHNSFTTPNNSQQLFTIPSRFLHDSFTIPSRFLHNSFTIPSQFLHNSFTFHKPYSSTSQHTTQRWTHEIFMITPTDRFSSVLLHSPKSLKFFFDSFTTQKHKS